MVMISLSTSPGCGPRFLAGWASSLSSRASQCGRNAWQKSSNWQKSSTSRSNIDASPHLMAPTQKEEFKGDKGLASPQTRNSGYFYNEGQVRIWPYDQADGGKTIDVLRRVRVEIPTGKLIVLWHGAPYHRAKPVWSAAGSLGIHLLPLPSYSPDLMAVEPLWRWLREDVTYHHCHATAEDLIRRVAAFEADVNADPCAVADRLWVKDHLDPEEEKLRFSN